MQNHITKFYFLSCTVSEGRYIQEGESSTKSLCSALVSVGKK